MTSVFEGVHFKRAGQKHSFLNSLRLRRILALLAVRAKQNPEQSCFSQLSQNSAFPPAGTRLMNCIHPLLSQ